MALTPETRTKKKIREDLKRQAKAQHPAFWWTPLSDRHVSGLPDFFFVEGGRAGFIEAKATKVELRPLQVHLAYELVMAGALYFVGYLSQAGELRYEEMTLEILDYFKSKQREKDREKEFNQNSYALLHRVVNRGV